MLALQACFGTSLSSTKARRCAKIVLITKLGGNILGNADPKQDHEDQESFVRRLQKIAAKKMLHASGWHERFLVVELVDNKALVHWVPEKQVRAVDVFVGFDRAGCPRIGYDRSTTVKCLVFKCSSNNELLGDTRRALEEHVSTPFELLVYSGRLLCEIPNSNNYMRVSWLVFNSPKFGETFYLQRDCTMAHLRNQLAARYNASASQYCFRVLDMWGEVTNELQSWYACVKCVDDIPFRRPRFRLRSKGSKEPPFEIYVSDQDTLSSVKLKILKLQHICVDSICHAFPPDSKVTDVSELEHQHDYYIVPKEATQEQKDHFLVSQPDFLCATLV